MDCCIFCGKDYFLQTVDKCHNGGPSVHREIFDFFGSQIESSLRKDDQICQSCLNFFETLNAGKRMFLTLVGYRDQADNDKKRKVIDAFWRSLMLATTLGKVTNREEDDRSENPLILSHSVPYEHLLEKQFEEDEHARVQCGQSIDSYYDNGNETSEDQEVKRTFKRGRRKNHHWSHRRGEQKSRSLSRTYEYNAYLNGKSYVNGRHTSCSVKMRRPSTSHSVKSTNSEPTRKRRQRKLDPSLPEITLWTRSHSKAQQDVADKVAQMQNNKFACGLLACEESFTTIEELTHHKIEHHHCLPMFSCEICKNNYTTLFDLEMHQKKHDITFNCPLCDEEKFGTQSIQDHLQDHLDYSVPCNYCDKSFVTAKLCELHMREVHQGTKHKVRYKPKPIKKEFYKIPNTVSRRRRRKRNSTLEIENYNFRVLIEDPKEKETVLRTLIDSPTELEWVLSEIVLESQNKSSAKEVTFEPPCFSCSSSENSPNSGNSASDTLPDCELSPVGEISPVGENSPCETAPLGEPISLGENSPRECVPVSLPNSDDLTTSNLMLKDVQSSESVMFDVGKPKIPQSSENAVPIVLLTALDPDIVNKHMSKLKK